MIEPSAKRQRLVTVPDFMLSCVLAFTKNKKRMFLAFPCATLKSLVLRWAAADGRISLNTQAFFHLKESNVRHLRLQNKYAFSLKPLVALKALRHLELRHLTGVLSLNPLCSLIHIDTLTLYYLKNVRSLEPLSILVRLRRLHVDWCTNLESLRGLPSALTHLTLRCCGKIYSLEPLRFIDALRHLELRHLNNVRSLKPLPSGLRHLEIRNMHGLVSLGPLPTGLRHLYISNLDIEIIGAIVMCVALIHLTLRGIRNIKSLEPLRDLKHLRKLKLCRIDMALDHLSMCTALTHLTLLDVRDIESLEPMPSGITHLRLAYVYIKSLKPLQTLRHLRLLELHRVVGVVSLKPLQGHRSLMRLNVQRLHVIKSSIEGIDVRVRNCRYLRDTA